MVLLLLVPELADGGDLSVRGERAQLRAQTPSSGKDPAGRARRRETLAGSKSSHGMGDGELVVVRRRKNLGVGKRWRLVRRALAPSPAGRA